MTRFGTGLLLACLTSSVAFAVPGKPAILSPVPGDYPERRPFIQWTEAPNAASYKVQILKAGQVFLEKSLARTTYTPTTDLPTGTYDVQVAGFDGAAYGEWSDPVSFRRVFVPYLSSLNGISEDGGNINLLAGPGITLALDPTNLTVTIGAGVNELVDGSVGSAKLADGSVTSLKVADGSLRNADLAPNAAIEDTKLAAITRAGKVANSATTATAANNANAIVARNVAGGFDAGLITAAFAGSGSALHSLNADQLASGTVPVARLPGAAARSNQVWLLGGNTGTTAGVQYLGTADAQSLVLKVNGSQALKLEKTSGAPNVIGGWNGNLAATGIVGAVIAGGGGYASTNRVDASLASIGGGTMNVILRNSHGAVIGGGSGNLIETNAPFGFISGGVNNTIRANTFYAGIAGGLMNTIHSNTSYASIGGGHDNTIGKDATSALIGGGNGNTIQVHSASAVIGGGGHHVIQTDAIGTVIDGGFNNTIYSNADCAAIGGGTDNRIGTNSTLSVIGGGANNTISFETRGATIGGGENNMIHAYNEYAVVCGGYNNSNNGNCSIIAGGCNNMVGDYGFAAGNHARATHQGAFVWADSGFSVLSSVVSNSVTFRATGGYRLFTNARTNAGVSLASGGTAWAVISDRTQKKDFQAVDGRAVLDKLAGMPITKWHYTWENEGDTPHIGPVAQDFIPAFYPGREETRITTQEADGVALAAIQGLNAKLADEVARLRAENKALNDRLDRLEQRLAP